MISILILMININADSFTRYRGQRIFIKIVDIDFSQMIRHLIICNRDSVIEGQMIYYMALRLIYQCLAIKKAIINGQSNSNRLTQMLWKIYE